MNWADEMRRYREQTYRCPKCLDTGIIAWLGDDLLWYGRKCNCSYFDRQREEARRKREGDA